MSKILKKITKKYKWLRFLNYKTTKLAVLSAALFGLCLSSGASFAKYRDENYGNGNAGTANFGDASLAYYNTPIQTPPLMEQKNYFGYYGFVAKFSVNISSSETKRLYTLSLKWGTAESVDYKSAISPKKTGFMIYDSSKLSSNQYIRENQETGYNWNCGYFYVTENPTSTGEVDKYLSKVIEFPLIDTNDTIDYEVIKNGDTLNYINLSDGQKTIETYKSSDDQYKSQYNNLKINYNNVYYSVTKNNGQKNWYIDTTASSNFTFDISNKEAITNSSIKIDYEILYFINFGNKTNDESYGKENARLLYNLIVEQVG